MSAGKGKAEKLGQETVLGPCDSLSATRNERRRGAALGGNLLLAVCAKWVVAFGGTQSTNSKAHWGTIDRRKDITRYRAISMLSDA